MSIVCLASAKGSPGVTTIAQAMAQSWPETGAVLAECDPSGSDLQMRLGLQARPSLATLLPVAKRGLTEEIVVGHTQAADGLRVLAGFQSPAHAARAAELYISLAELYANSRTTLLCDVGRIAPGSGQDALIRASSLAIFVCRDDTASVLRTREALGRIRSARLLVLIDAGGHDAAEVSASLGIEVAVVLSSDLGARRPRRFAAAAAGLAGRANEFVRRHDPGGPEPDVSRQAMDAASRQTRRTPHVQRASANELPTGVVGRSGR